MCVFSKCWNITFWGLRALTMTWIERTNDCKHSCWCVDAPCAAVARSHISSRDEWARSARGDTVMMAAVRRFLALRNKFTSSTNGLSLYFNSRRSWRERAVLRRVGTGLFITVGGFAVVYYQHNASLRALISPLPAVAAKEKVSIS